MVYRSETGTSAASAAWRRPWQPPAPRAARPRRSWTTAGIYLAEQMRDRNTVRRFTFKLQQSVFIGDNIRVQCQPDRCTAAAPLMSGTDTGHATTLAVTA